MIKRLTSPQRHREHRGEPGRVTTNYANDTKREERRIARRGWRKSRGAIYFNPSGVFPLQRLKNLLSPRSQRTPSKPHGGPPCGELQLMSKIVNGVFEKLALL